ncbi:MAG: hypothetical protein IRZ29_07730 [Thermoflavifilum sp.]|nr:hypothetical protein [Thermoflavifilum sp.]
MKKYFLIVYSGMLGICTGHAQSVWTPERVAEAPYISSCWTGSFRGVHALYYVITAYDIERNMMRHQLWVRPIDPLQDPPAPRQLLSFNGEDIENMQELNPNTWLCTRGHQCYWLRTDSPSLRQFTHIDSPYAHLLVSPKKDYVLFLHAEKVRDVEARDYYPQFGKTTARIYHALPAFDAAGWEDGYAHHLFYARFDSLGRMGMPVDLMPYEWTNLRPALSNGRLNDVQWSPDERYVAYAAYKPGEDHPDLPGGRTSSPKAPSTPAASEIYLYDLQDGLTDCLSCQASSTQHPASVPIRHESPLFNPSTAQGKSRWIAWIAEPLAGEAAGQRDLILADMDRKIQYNLTHSWGGRVWHFWWSNDGQSLLFTASYPDSMGVELYQVQVLDGNRLHTPLVIQQLTHLHMPVATWVGETPSAWLLAISRWGRAQEVIAVDKRAGTVYPLAQADTSVESEPPVQTSLCRLANGLHVWINRYLPAHFDATRSYPAIICLPDLQEFDEEKEVNWHHPQMLADAGYQVFVLSPAYTPSFSQRAHAANRGLNWIEESFYLDSAVVASLADSLCHLLYPANTDPPVVQSDNQVVLLGSGWGAHLALMLASNQLSREEGGQNQHLPCLNLKGLVLWNPVADVFSWQAATSDRWLAAQMEIGSRHEGSGMDAQHQPYLPDLPMLIGVGGRDGWVPAGQGLGLFNVLQDKGIRSRLLYFPQIAHYWPIGHDLLVWQHQVLNWLQSITTSP